MSLISLVLYGDWTDMIITPETFQLPHTVVVKDIKLLMPGDVVRAGGMRGECYRLVYVILAKVVKLPERV